jgi:hypothetical protein
MQVRLLGLINNLEEEGIKERWYMYYKNKNLFDLSVGKN